MTSIHGLTVHLHTGILVIALILTLICILIRLITFMYPRWGLIRDLFTDWSITKKIWDHRGIVFKAFDYTTIICVALGLIGLLIGIYTGGEAVNWSFEATEILNRAKLILSLYALIFFGLALLVRAIPNMWRNPGLIVLYGLTIGIGFLFIFLDGAVGGIWVYHESIAEPMLHWLSDIGFFRLLGLDGLVGALPI